MDTNLAPPQLYSSPTPKYAPVLSNLSNFSFQPSDSEDNTEASDRITDSNYYPPEDSYFDSPDAPPVHVALEDPPTNQAMPDAVHEILTATPASSIPPAASQDRHTDNAPPQNQPSFTQPPPAGQVSLDAALVNILHTLADQQQQYFQYALA